MATLDSLPNAEFIKMFLIGDSGTGKTGALISLMQAGYKIRIVDLDNGTAALRQFGLRECPDKLKNVDVETLRDVYISGPAGPRIKGTPRAFTDTLKLLTKWSDDTDPATWGSDHVLVLDSMTMLGKAAFAWAQAMNPSAKDPRQWFYSAQRALESTVDLLCGSAMATNVIIISHITSIDEEGGMKGYPTTVGKALSKTIAQYVNIMLLCETVGSGKNVRRTIKTLPTPTVDLKNPAPFKIEGTLDLATGLAEFFAKMKE